MITCIGHITHDRVKTPEFCAEMPGGTAWYFAHAMARLGVKDFRLLTCVGPDEEAAVESLRTLGVETEAVKSPRSVFFENIYGHDPNQRTQRVLSKAHPFDLETIRSAKSGVFHLGTLLADDFAPEAIKELAVRGLVSVDAQGFLRRVVGECVEPCDWKEKRSVLPYVGVLKANEQEMVSLTGEKDPGVAARILADWGVKEVVLTLGDRGSLILREGVETRIPAFGVEKVTDTTGCGDTYMAGYLWRRNLGECPAEAGRYAAAMCTLKLATKGPFSGTHEDVVRIVSGRSQAGSDC